MAIDPEKIADAVAEAVGEANAEAQEAAAEAAHDLAVDTAIADTREAVEAVADAVETIGAVPVPPTVHEHGEYVTRTELAPLLDAMAETADELAETVEQAVETLTDPVADAAETSIGDIPPDAADAADEAPRSAHILTRKWSLFGGNKL